MSAAGRGHSELDELLTSVAGDGRALLLIHPTGASSCWFDPAVEDLRSTHRVVTYDRLGWGKSLPLGDYSRTSIAEQSIEAAGVLRHHTVERAVVLGVGFGAVVALELTLAEPDLVENAVLIEPPLLDTLVEATEGMSRDVAALREAAEDGGEVAVWRLFVEGGLSTLGAGAARLAREPDGPGGADELAAAGTMAAHSLLVELPAVPAWPLDPVRLGAIEVPVTVASTPSTPDLLKRAADALVPRIPGARRVFTQQAGPAAVVELLR